MNTALARELLTRITRLFDDIHAADGAAAASSLERDLLREYVRRFYEALADQPDWAAGDADPQAPAHREVQQPRLAASKPQSRPSSAPPPQRDPPVSPPTPRFAFDPSPTQATPPPAPARTSPQTAPAPASPPPKPRIVEVPASVEADIASLRRGRVGDADRAPSGIAAAVPPAGQVASAAAGGPAVPESPFAPEPAALDPKLRELFRVEASGELSERLAGAPVADLTRAMSINDRLLAQNDLFGSDKQALDAALAHLNGLPDYAAAVSYLGGGAAVKYDWLDEERRPTARTFVRLVRRRYPS